ncbi:MAG: type II toxin-antitoxin system HicB family antitoxin [Heliobacteriaceae bacterium]|jgi:predicted RNase H-like HicB family nuclease|nr:type II toxin-antitoxin system HicB family antitoxin [Heliobacteriaceae bacterium]
MTEKIKKDLNYYLNLPWQFEITKHPEGGYSSRVIGLSCYSGGDTPEEALSEIKVALEVHIEGCLEENFPIPEPQLENENATGRLNFRTSKSTHLKLIKKAKEEDVSVSHLINDAIVKAYG